MARTEKSLEEVFTRYVKALAVRSSPTSALFDETWQALRRVLARELRRRSLWASPPSFVGVYGWESWSAGDADLGKIVGPLEELLTDCYMWTFHEQLPVLLSQLRVKPAIDGLVVLFVRKFLTERQKDHDPLGYRIYELLRNAIKTAVDAEELYIIRGRRAIRNSTILAAVPDADPEEAVSMGELQPIVEGWNNDLLPGLITAGGKEWKQVIDQLRRHLFDLEFEGVTVFRFKDVVDPMKHNVRVRWAALYALGAGDVLTKRQTDEDGEFSRTLIHVLRLESDWEAVESFQRLSDCVPDLIQRLEEHERTRLYLETLWNFLRCYAVDEAIDGLPSNRKMEKELHIPRDRLPALYVKIGDLIRRCQAKLARSVDR